MTTQAEVPLGRRAARGAAVTLGGQGLRILIQLVSVIVLARLLSPSDYGLVAMVVVIVGFGEILRDFGLSSAAIQSGELSTDQRSTLFWINTGIGAVLALALVAAAPLIAILFDEPRLELLARVIAIVFVLNGLTTQYRASLVRSLRFTATTTAEVCAAAIGLAGAVVAAVAGAGYWSLVVQQLTQAAAMLLSLGLASRWLPALPRRGTPVRHFLGFGGGVVGSQIVGYLSNNVDTFVIGLRFGAAPLGIYTRAFQLLMTPLNQVRSPLTTVALPVLSRLADDPARFDRFVLLGQRALGYTIVAGLAFVAAVAEPLTHVLLGAQWDDSAPILRLLAIAGIFQTLAFVGYWVYLARGLTTALFHYSLLSATIRIACVLIGSQWGLVGVALGYAIAPALSWPLSFWWLSRRTRLPTARLYSGAGRILGTAGFGALLAVLTSRLPIGEPLQLAVGACAALIGFVALAIVPAVRRDFRDVLSLSRHLRRLRS